MAYFEDLSSYSYHHSGILPGTLNVGWLEKGKPFPVGKAPEGFLEKLWPYCKLRVMQMRGLHACEFCDLPRGTYPFYKFADEEIRLGSAEIRIFADSDTMFASPNLVFHYIQQHHYLPPDAFIRAVLKEPGPSSPDYIARLKALSLLDEY